MVYPSFAPLPKIKHLDQETATKSLTSIQVGGSSGEVVKAIAARYPNLTFQIQDQPLTVAKGIADLPADLKSRISFLSHDFFTPNPVKPGEAAVFFLRFILHDWPKPLSIQILRNLLPSMVPNETKLVICDVIVPEAGEVPLFEERALRLMDMQMMAALNAGERTVSDWEDLLGEVGLKITKRHKPAGSAMSLIETMLVV